MTVSTSHQTKQDKRKDGDNQRHSFQIKQINKDLKCIIIVFSLKSMQDIHCNAIAEEGTNAQ